MRILFYTMNWYPFEGSIQHIYAAVLKYLKKRGHKITILTSVPYFMNGREEKWKSYRRKFFATEYWEGIKVIRTFVISPYFLRRFRKGIRAINFISFTLTSLFAGLSLKKPDIILTVSHPPLFIGLNSYIISRIKRCKYVYCLEDIYPDILFDLGLLKKGMAATLLKKVELFVYNRASKICLLSSQMLDNLKKKGVPPDKLELIPHFADLDKIIPLPKLNPFAKEYAFDSKFIVLLPGSISCRYGIDTIFESAKLLSKNEGIKFVFIERGELKDAFKQKVKSEKVRNIQFLPFQPTDKFPEVLASADVCLVSLEARFSSYSVPSKIYNIMASARPIIAITDENSEVAEVVKTARCGINVPPDNPALLSQVIEKLAADKQKCNTMGQNGYKYSQVHFNKDDICRKYEDLICGTANI